VGAVKVLFLDIDGVLNSAEWYGRRPRELRDLPNTDHNVGLCEIDPEAVARLGRIVDATGARIVISSTWRRVFRLPTIRLLLAERGLRAEVVGVTPDLGGVAMLGRGEEIRAWLAAHPDVTAFAVLDDNDEMDAVREAFVPTWLDGEDGLADEHVERVIALLGRADVKESA
jgi:hypothetical protein